MFSIRDLCNIIDMVQFNQNDLELLRKSVIFYSVISAEKIKKDFSFEALQKITIRRVITDLFPVIACKEHFDLEEKLIKVENFIEHLMVLTENEKQFIDCFSRKELRLDLLFDDFEIIERLKSHPMIKWRLCK